MPRLRHYGNTSPEYVVILGLVVVAALGGLSLMGGSISELLGGMMNNLSSGGTSSKVLGLLSPISNPSGPVASGTAANGSAGAENGNSDSSVNVSISGIESGTNTTSVDGVRMDSSGSFALSARIEALIPKDEANETDYREVADIIYSMAGTQAYIEKVPELQVITQSQQYGTYTPELALADMAAYSEKLDALVEDLPVGSPNVETVKELAATAQEIAHSEAYLGSVTNVTAMASPTPTFEPRLEEKGLDLPDILANAGKAGAVINEVVQVSQKTGSSVSTQTASSGKTVADTSNTSASQSSSANKDSNSKSSNSNKGSNKDAKCNNSGPKNANGQAAVANANAKNAAN